MDTTKTHRIMAFSEPVDLHVTVVSAKHLKNVNWRHGDLEPYAVLYLHPEHRVSTRSDGSCSTKPVWNERLAIPLNRSFHESVLTVEIFHSQPSDQSKTLVGSVRFPLTNLVGSDKSLSAESVHSLQLVRPSGRPQGKIRLRLAIKDRPPRYQPQLHDYYSAALGVYYHSSAPPVGFPARDYREFSPSTYPYAENYVPGYYHPPPPPRPMYDRPSNYGLPSGSLSPVDAFPSNDHKPTPPPPVFSRLSNYSPRNGSSAAVHALPSNHQKPQAVSCLSNHGAPSGPTASVDAFPLSNYQKPPVVPRLSNYRVPSGPSAPLDYTPYDHKHLQKGVAGFALEDARAESDFGTRVSYCYASDYRHDCWEGKN